MIPSSRLGACSEVRQTIGGIAEPVQLYAHAIHQSKIETARAPIVVAAFEIGQDAAMP
jgi:hypothetical protein